MKKIAAFITIAMAMLGMCGCASSEDIALKHLKDKYNQEFKIVDVYPENIDVPYDEIILEDENGNKFSTCIQKDEDGNKIIRDDYYGLLKKDEYNEIVKSIIGKYLSEYKHFSNLTAGYYPNQYDCNYELKDALQDDPIAFFSDNYIFVDKETAMQTSESVYDEIANEIAGYGLSTYLVIYDISEDEYKRIDENEDVSLFIPDDYDSMANPLFKKTIPLECNLE